MVVQSDPQQFNVMNSYLERKFLADLIMVSKSRALRNPFPVLSALTKYSNHGINKKLLVTGDCPQPFAS